MYIRTKTSDSVHDFFFLSDRSLVLRSCEYKPCLALCCNFSMLMSSCKSASKTFSCIILCNKATQLFIFVILHSTLFNQCLEFRSMNSEYGYEENGKNAPISAHCARQARWRNLSLGNAAFDLIDAFMQGIPRDGVINMQYQYLL